MNFFGAFEELQRVGKGLNLMKVMKNLIESF